MYDSIFSVCSVRKASRVKPGLHVFGGPIMIVVHQLDLVLRYMCKTAQRKFRASFNL